MLFYLAMLLITENAPCLSYGYKKTGDSFNLFTNTDSTRAGMAHKTLRLIRLSNFDMMEENMLRNSGPTKRHANNRRQDLFLDFSTFCSKKRTN